MKATTQLAPGVKHIPYGSELHKKIISNFDSRKRLAKGTARSKQQKQWEQNEDTYTAYMPETDVDDVQKAETKGAKLEYTTISIPYSYAMLLTAHTYYTSVFLARDPIFQLKGRHGEAQDAETA